MAYNKYDISYFVIMCLSVILIVVMIMLDDFNVNRVILLFTFLLNFITSIIYFIRSSIERNKFVKDVDTNHSVNKPEGGKNG